MLARPEVLDTSVLIRAVRSGYQLGKFVKRLSSGSVYLSSVAHAEFVVGTADQDEARVLERFSASVGPKRILTPTHMDWQRAAQVIRRHSDTEAYLKPRDHIADVLILVSAARIRGTVVTANVHHFEHWADLARRMGLDVTVSPYKHPARRS